MNETAYERVIRKLREHGCKVVEKGGQRTDATCPAHEDHAPSLSVTGIQGQCLVHCHTGCDYRDVLATLELTPADLYDERSATYRYDDGRTVKRFYDERGKKRFAQTGAGPTSTLYHLAQLEAAGPDRYVFLVEGEKDVHAIEAAGGIATTAPQGAQSFGKADVTPLSGRLVVCVVDRDERGDDWAAQVAAKLEGVAKAYRFVRAATGKDAADHIAAGHDLNAFEAYEPPVDDVVDEPPSRLERMTEQKLLELRAVEQAREILDQERHARSWSPPASYGTLTEELAIPAPEVSYRFKGILGAGHNALLIATRKAGKTTLINHAVRCLADGEQFLGRFDTTPVDGTIAVFNYEVGAEQYRDWMRDVRIENSDKVHMLHLRGKRLPLIDPRVRAWVTQWLRERQVKVWIVDPFSRAAVGSVLDGNAEFQVGTFLDNLDVIKAEAGVEELIMPAHTPKARVDSGEESASGSQRLEGWPDALWYVTKDDAGLRYMRAEGRDVDVAEEQLTYDQNTRGLVLGGWDRRTAAANRDAEHVRAYVEANAGCTQNAIGSEMGWGPTRTSKAVSAAKLRREPGPGRSTLHFLA
ncbi:AAA family ATPase [Actinoplanes sp. NPDC051861]|uniref:AAA family ATPase n=1 Tax=Actinoplanes sp. NPDC051861 TaxID=3155170 RepID=UPI0034240F26